jgi:hypothetical protein
MTNHFVLRALVLLTLLSGMTGLVRADPPKDDKALAEQFREFAKGEASAYTIRLEGSDRPLTLRPEPVLKWTNPIAGTIFGDVFIWTDQGRPEVVVSIYKFYSPLTHRSNEFHSLALGKVSAARHGTTVWTPSRPGVELKPIPGAGSPADSTSARLRQMRALAQEFTGRQNSRQGVEREMRLLAQPVYRYENTKEDLIDGGLFAFVVGTDPEVLLLIEARRPSGGGAPEWRFGAARMNSIDLWLNRGGREVWRASAITWQQGRDASEPYTSFRFESTPGKR